MDTNEIMTNEDVVETIEAVTDAGFEKGFKMAAGIGLVILTGVIVYKYVAKPVMVKIKNKKNQQEVDVDEGDAEDVEVDGEVDESE